MRGAGAGLKVLIEAYAALTSSRPFDEDC
jgi:hypothetical protein